MTRKTQCPSCGKNYDSDKRSTCPLCRFDPKTQQIDSDSNFEFQSLAGNGDNFFQLGLIPNDSEISGNSRIGGATDSNKVDENSPKILTTPTSSKRQQSSNTGSYELIRAQDRTTRAIRSLAIFFFVNLTACIIGSVVIWAGIAFVNAATTVVGAFIVILGFGIALASGIEELRQSGKGLN